MYSSEIKNKVGKLFSKTYDIANILENYMDALILYIDLIERNEPRSNYVLNS